MSSTSSALGTQSAPTVAHRGFDDFCTPNNRFKLSLHNFYTVLFDLFALCHASDDVDVAVRHRRGVEGYLLLAIRRCSCRSMRRSELVSIAGIHSFARQPILGKLE